MKTPTVPRRLHPGKPRRAARLLLLVTISLVAVTGQAAAPKIVLRTDHPTGVFQPGETVTWTVSVEGEKPAPDQAVFPFNVKKDDADEVGKGTVDLSSGTATITGTRDEPGTLVAHIMPLDAATNKYALPVATGAAVFAPEKLGPAAPPPADFDAFWSDKLKELAQVPVHPQLQKVDNLPNSAGVDYCKVTLDNIRGTHVQGQLARPSKEGKYPAILMVQFAGVYGLDRPALLNQARQGWLALNISAHDLPIDEAEQFYKDLKEGALKNYIYLGSEDRDKSYFLRMLLGCARAVDYLVTRPDWDGKTLIVTGASQGGMQSFATAALRPQQITGVMTLVPAGCDSFAPEAHPARAFGWPYWLSNWGPKERDMQKVRTTAGYYDTIYFAQRTKCPTLVGVGLLDNTARPTGVIAAYNAVRGPKELVIMPLSAHQGDQSVYFKRLYAWEAALVHNQPFPPPDAAK